MNARIKQLVAVFEHHKIDAFLVTKSVNITYLTGFPACESWLLVSPKKTYYITDFRYILEARKGLKGITVKRYTKSIYKTVFELLKALRIKRLGFDDRHFTVAEYKALCRAGGKRNQVVSANNLVENFRAVKDAGEIRKTRNALKIHGQAHNLLKKGIKPGISERDILHKLEKFAKEKNVGFSFDPIVASGPNSCYPHASVTSRRIRNHEPVLIDMGIDFQGYKSDLTRMFLLGKIPQLVQRVNDFVQEAQHKAIKKIQPGMPVAELDRLARNHLAKKRLAKYFGHALGHGVGLEIHESPRLSQNNSSILKEGMIITIEPAVYIPNKFGIRIEDMVLVKKRGCEVLSADIH